MSKKDKRIKELEQLNANMAIECDEMEMTISRLHGSNIKMIDGLLRIRKERDELQRLYDERGEYVAYLEGQVDDLIATVQRVEGQVDSLAHDLGECQAGREAEKIMLVKQRYIDDLAPVAVWKAHAKETAAYADDMKAENAELKSKIKAITTAAVDWAEHGSALIAELLDGDE